jgi:hypothetical protein
MTTNASSDLPRGVRGVAIFFIVQGLLETMMGLLCGVVGPFVASGLNVDPNLGKIFDPDHLRTLALVVYILLGLLGVGCGIVKVVAGVKSLSLKGGALRFVALASCIPTALICYCAPSALALGIWGLIVHVRPDVKAAFASRAR